MKIIKLVLALLPQEFEKEQRELADYIRSLNDIYIKRDIFFQLTVCADAADLTRDGNKEGEQGQEIRDAHYFYVLFGRKAQRELIDQFEIALKQFHETKAPRIYTYFYQLPQGEDAEQEVVNFMERLDKEIGHFYSRFSHLDSIKLNVLLEMARSPEVQG